MATTKMKCPHCPSTLHEAAIVPDMGKHYLELTCSNCRNQLLFVLDLSPEFLGLVPLPNRSINRYKM